MADLKTQIRDYMDATAPTVEVDLPTMEVATGRPPAKSFRARRGLAVAFASAAAFVAVFAGVIWLLGPGEDTEPSVAEPREVEPPAPILVPDTAPAPSLPEVDPPSPTVPSAPVQETEADVIDYAAEGKPVGTTEVSFGSIDWLSFRRVPSAWIVEGGFPTPYFGFKRSWIPLYEAAPEGVEIFEVTGGYVGLGGSTADAYAERDPRRTPMWYGPDILQDGVWFSSDGESWEQMSEGPIDSGTLTTHDAWMLAERDGRFVLVGWADSGYVDNFLVLWDNFGNHLESDAGSVMVEVDDDGNPAVDGNGNLLLFDTGGNRLDPEEISDAEGNPVDIVEGLVSGDVNIAPIGGDIRRGRPMAWVSDDLITWERVTAEFEKPGMITDLESVVATDTGWFILGARRTDTSDGLEKRVAEWAAWASPDGRVWEEIPIHELIGAPENCTPRDNQLNCIRVRAHAAPGGGVVVYAYQWETTANTFNDFTWELFIGFPG